MIRPFLQGAADDAHAPSDLDAAVRIRPFLLTRGRTSGATEIAIEAQVTATRRGLASTDALSFEYRDIVDLCRDSLAVAEIAARLGLHIGVARVLIGDLAHEGLVTTFESDDDVMDDVEKIERVIHGLRQRS